MENHERFLCALFRFKKLGASFPTGCDIQYTEYAVMRSIGVNCPSCGASLNMAEIQQKLHISKPAVSQILSSLERKGYIIRRIDPADRRKISVAPTPAGRTVTCKAEKVYTAALQDLSSLYGPEELLALTLQLEQLMEAYAKIQQKYQQEK